MSVFLVLLREQPQSHPGRYLPGRSEKRIPEAKAQEKDRVDHVDIKHIMSLGKR